jgi:VTC domain
MKRTDITRFPHAVLEVKLSLPEGTPKPAWVEELICSGMVSEVHKFSKFIHGVCTLFPELCQARLLVFLARMHRCSRDACCAMPPHLPATAAGVPGLLSTRTRGRMASMRLRRASLSLRGRARA